VVLYFRHSSHAGKTAVGVGLDVRVVWVSVFPDIVHFFAIGSDAVHSLFPHLDVIPYEHVGIPLAANIDVSSSFDRFWVQWCFCFYIFRIFEGTLGELSCFDVDACHGH